MKVKDFIDEYCRRCDDFDPESGCSCHMNEECDESRAEPSYRGKSMRLRVDEHCLKKGTGEIKRKISSLEKRGKKKPAKAVDSLDDIILQIWNDGAEYIIYDDSDLKHFRKTIIETEKKKKKRK